ncbi:MAG: hypothetical protein R6U51_06665 [Anaerolineales bacterium]
MTIHPLHDQHATSKYPFSLKEESGFTLVEELVTIAIIGLGIIILVTMITTGAIGVRKVDDLVTAESLARSQSELIKNAPYELDPTSSPYPTVSPVPEYSVSVTIEYWDWDPSAGSGTFTPTWNNDGMQKIIVSVSSDGDTLKQISTYKVDR